MVLEFVGTVLDAVTLVVEGGVVVDSAAAESINDLKECVAAKMDVIVIGLGVVVVSAAILVTLVVLADNEDIEGVLEAVGIIVATNGINILDITERIKFKEDIIEFLKLDLLAVGAVAIVKEEFMFCWRVGVSTGAGVVTDIAVVAGTGGVGE